MNLPDCLQQGSMGEIRFAGSRIDLYFVIEAYQQGWPAEAIALRYETLRLADIQKAIKFYHESKAEVDAYVEETNRLYDEIEATTPRVDLEKLRARLTTRESTPATKAAG
jgi:uncharacterized protein (DUF433 family)